MVRTLTQQRALGYLMINLSRGAKGTIERGEKLIELNDHKLELFKSYDANLVDTAGSVIADKATTGLEVRSTTSDYSNTFNEDSPLEWAVNADKLDDIDSERD